MKSKCIALVLFHVLHIPLGRSVFLRQPPVRRDLLTDGGGGARIIDDDNNNNTAVVNVTSNNNNTAVVNVTINNNTAVVNVTSNNNNTAVGNVTSNNNNTAVVNVPSNIYKIPSVICRMVMINTMFQDDMGQLFSSNEESGCIPQVNGTESDQFIPLDLPANIRNSNLQLLEQGRLIVYIYNASVTSQTITTNAHTTFYLPTDDLDHVRYITQPMAIRTGTLTVAVIYVTTLDASPVETAADLASTLFDSTKINFITQYNRCSVGNLQFVPSTYGVITVQVPQPISTYANTGGLTLVLAAQDVLKNQMQVNSFDQIADRLMFCVPPGTGTWVASAGINHWRAQFNSGWCSSLTATMHELGHTLGLLHSNKNFVKYADATGYMSMGYRSATWPLRCFNGQENDQLGWYDARKMYFDPTTQSPEIIVLAAFVDFNLTLPDMPVLVNVADEVYLQYNRAKSFNNGSGDCQDMVTITTKPIDGGSQLLAGLRAGERYAITNFKNASGDFIIEICRPVPGDGVSNPDMMVVSIGMDISYCNYVGQSMQTVVQTKTAEIPSMNTHSTGDNDQVANSQSKTFANDQKTLSATATKSPMLINWYDRRRSGPHGGR